MFVCAHARVREGEATTLVSSNDVATTFFNFTIFTKVLMFLITIKINKKII